MLFVLNASGVPSVASMVVGRRHRFGDAADGLDHRARGRTRPSADP
jgi:hypothetical protein